jgi:hypothetical protein
MKKQSKWKKYCVFFVSWHQACCFPKEESMIKCDVDENNYEVLLGHKTLILLYLSAMVCEEGSPQYTKDSRQAVLS